MYHVRNIPLWLEQFPDAGTKVTISSADIPYIKESVLHRNGLQELAKIVTADNTELYEKLVSDLGETGTKFQSWWDRMAQKYQWESAPDGNWEINFDTKEIFLVQP